MSGKVPGKLGGMVSMFEKKAEDSRESTTPTSRSAGNSLSSQHSTIAERMAAMQQRQLTSPSSLPSSASSSPALSPTPPSTLPGKLPASKTLPPHFGAADSPIGSPTSSSSIPPRAPSKLQLGAMAGINAALANGLRKGITPGSALRSPSSSLPRDEKPAEAPEEKKESPDAAEEPADDAQDRADLTHATRSRVKRAGKHANH